MKKLFLSSLVFLALLAPAAAASITITGTACDTSGACGPFSVIVQTDVVSIISAVVAPAVAPTGTARALTVVANSSAGSTLSGVINPVNGITFTPVSGQPAGTFVWTFVY